MLLCSETDEIVGQIRDIFQDKLIALVFINDRFDMLVDGVHKEVAKTTIRFDGPTVDGLSCIKAIFGAFNTFISG